MNLDTVIKIDNQANQDLIVSKIKGLISHKNLETGDKLPSERMLSERFETSRGNIRDAIKKLEFYGILKTVPKSGTFIANIGSIAINGMIDDILSLQESSFKDLVETRILLELKIARLAALRRTKDDLIKIKKALDTYTKKALSEKDAVQEDLLFHLAIAKSSRNVTMNTFMLIITPEIITNFNKHHICDDDMAFKGIKEHEAIYQAIVEQNPEKAKKKMKEHFKVLYNYCYNENLIK